MILVIVIWLAIAVLMTLAYMFGAWIGEARATERYERYMAERERDES